ncbi:unnamed protein product [Linum trigynum]|uniref:Uncharacterized protein n=1 Tax=Linum trigynum TaxID=586398 RepID=A0AAV2CIP0_9ROSI
MATATSTVSAASPTSLLINPPAADWEMPTATRDRRNGAEEPTFRGATMEEGTSTAAPIEVMPEDLPPGKKMSARLSLSSCRLKILSLKKEEVMDLPKAVYSPKRNSPELSIEEIPEQRDGVASLVARGRVAPDEVTTTKDAMRRDKARFGASSPPRRGMEYMPDKEPDKQTKMEEGDGDSSLSWESMTDDGKMKVETRPESGFAPRCLVPCSPPRKKMATKFFELATRREEESPVKALAAGKRNLQTPCVVAPGVTADQPVFRSRPEEEVRKRGGGRFPLTNPSLTSQGEPDQAWLGKMGRAKMSAGPREMGGWVGECYCSLGHKLGS